MCLVAQNHQKTLKYTLTGKKSESPKVCIENGSFFKRLATVNISFEKITQNILTLGFWFFFVHDMNLKSEDDKFFPTMRFAVVTFRGH